MIKCEVWKDTSVGLDVRPRALFSACSLASSLNNKMPHPFDNHNHIPNIVPIHDRQSMYDSGRRYYQWDLITDFIYVCKSRPKLTPMSRPISSITESLTEWRDPLRS